ncbi:MAG: TIGR02147 family protein, partial [Fibrobacter sp.]|nr:TIGR02147 family protein [Fibrobacter sp.]
MKPIVEYSDFRQYMLDYYEERKRRSVFSWREFSKIAGFSSSSYMKVVCDGKSKLSRIGVERTGAAMGLVGFEMEYFRAMVEFGQAATEEKKKAAYENMLAIAKI